MKPGRTTIVLAAAVLLAAVIALYFVLRPQAPAGLAPGHSGADLAAPDAFLTTRSLSQLPKDLRAQPLLRDVIGEDFFFYYENQAGRLSLQGVLRRIAFEHNLDLSDQLLRYVLDVPARLALWKTPDGKLGQFMLVVDRGPLLQALELLAKAVLADSQLKAKGSLPGGGDTIYQLDYAHGRRLFFAGQGGHLLVFSHAALVLPDDAGQQAKAAEFLKAADPGAWLGNAFALGEGKAAHSVAVSANYLSFGYQRFFPALQALRFDFTEGGWSAALRSRGGLPSAKDLWRRVPGDPALCLALPVEPAAAVGLLGKFIETSRAQDLLEAMEAPAALCWYKQTRLYAPLAAIKLKPGKALDADLRALFEQFVGNREAGYQEQTAADSEPAVKHYPPFPVQETVKTGGTLWRRNVSSPYGLLPVGELADAEQARSSQYFPVTLAHWGDTLLFSPDASLVDNAIAAVDKTYPPLADSLAGREDALAVVLPAQAAQLAGASLEESLPSESEELFHKNVSERLQPVLDRLQDWPAYALPAPADSTAWQALHWHALPPR